MIQTILTMFDGREARILWQGRRPEAKDTQTGIRLRGWALGILAEMASDYDWEYDGAGVFYGFKTDELDTPILLARATVYQAPTALDKRAERPRPRPLGAVRYARKCVQCSRYEGDCYCNG